MLGCVLRLVGCFVLLGLVPSGVIGMFGTWRGAWCGVGCGPLCTVLVLYVVPGVVIGVVRCAALTVTLAMVCFLCADVLCGIFVVLGLVLRVACGMGMSAGLGVVLVQVHRVRIALMLGLTLRRERSGVLAMELVVGLASTTNKSTVFFGLYGLF